MEHQETDAIYSHILRAYVNTDDGTYKISEGAIWELGAGDDNLPEMYRKAISKILKADVFDCRQFGDHGIFLEKDDIYARSAPDSDIINITIHEAFSTFDRTRTVNFHVRDHEKEIFQTRVRKIRRALDAMSNGTERHDESCIEILDSTGSCIERVSNTPGNISPIWIEDFFYLSDHHVLTLWKYDLKRITRHLPSLEAHYEDAKRHTEDLAHTLTTILEETLNAPISDSEKKLADDYAMEHARYGTITRDPVAHYTAKAAAARTTWMRNYAAYRMPLEYSQLFTEFLNKFETILERLNIKCYGVDLNYDSFTQRWEIRSNLVDDIDYLRKQTDTVKLAALIHMIGVLVDRAKTVGIEIN